MISMECNRFSKKPVIGQIKRLSDLGVWVSGLLAPGSKLPRALKIGLKTKKSVFTK